MERQTTPTAEHGDAFSQPAVVAGISTAEQRLRRQLRKRRVHADTIDDVLQETASRLYRTTAQFRTRKAFLRWYLLVGNRIATRALEGDARWRRANTELGLPAHGPDAADQAVRGLAIRSAVGSLTDTQLEGVGYVFKPPAATLAEQHIENMRLGRARARIQARLDELLAVLGVRVGRRLAAVRKALRSLDVAPVGAAATGLALGAVLGGYNASGAASVPHPLHRPALSVVAAAARTPVDGRRLTAIASRPAAATAQPRTTRERHPKRSAAAIPALPGVSASASASRAVVKADADDDTTHTWDAAAIDVHCDTWFGHMVCPLPTTAKPTLP